MRCPPGRKENLPLRRFVLHLVVAAAGLLVAGCQDAEPPKLTADEVVLSRRITKLRSLLDANPTGPLIPFGDVLVIVSEPLLQSLVDAALPIEGAVAGRYLLRLDRAKVTLDDGLALLRLEGRAAIAGAIAEAAFADVVIQANLDVVELDAASRTLVARVRVLAFDATEMNLLGVNAPGRDLVAGFARERLEELEPMLSSIEIPVRIEHDLELPEVGPLPITIAARAVPLTAKVTSVIALRHQLFVSLEVELDVGTGSEHFR